MNGPMQTPVLDEQKKEQRDEPPMFTVKILNDDFSPIQLVTAILIEVFKLSHDDAELYTFTIHANGSVTIGSYTRDIAESKAALIVALAQENDAPLLAQAEQL